MDKNQLREEALRLRDRTKAGGIDVSVLPYLFMHNLQPQGKNVALYWPMGSEVDTRPLISYLLGQGITCALPVMWERSKELRFYHWNEQQPLVTTRYNVMQPAAGDLLDPDIVIVPLLAFDMEGHRLGYGGGYYDVTLQALRGRKEILAVGLAYDEQRIEILPVEKHDQRLDCLITPRGFCNFN